VYIVASDLIENLSHILNSKLEVVDNLRTETLSQSVYSHPIYKDKDLTFVSASHATATKGTGLVHTAPAHGPEDFLVALNEKMEIVKGTTFDFPANRCFSDQFGGRARLLPR
jgi:isoleucyl-tRNA synthetase